MLLCVQYTASEGTWTLCLMLWKHPWGQPLRRWNHFQITKRKERWLHVFPYPSCQPCSHPSTVGYHWCKAWLHCKSLPHNSTLPLRKVILYHCAYIQCGVGCFSTHRIVGISTISRTEHSVPQTREVACTKEVLPQVIAQGYSTTRFYYATREVACTKEVLSQVISQGYSTTCFYYAIWL